MSFLGHGVSIFWFWLVFAFVLGLAAQAQIRIVLAMPTLAVVDLHLPDGNGIQIPRSLRLMAPDLPIAILTNDANAFNRRRSLAAEASWIFDKSTELMKLLELVGDRAHSTNLTVS